MKLHINSNKSVRYFLKKKIIEQLKTMVGILSKSFSPLGDFAVPKLSSHGIQTVLMLLLKGFQPVVQKDPHRIALFGFPVDLLVLQSPSLYAYLPASDQIRLQVYLQKTHLNGKQSINCNSRTYLFLHKIVMYMQFKFARLKTTISY